MKKYPIDESFFDEWSHSMAYILGFIVADGHIHPKNRIEINLNTKDEDVLLYIHSKICPTKPIYRSLIRNPRNPNEPYKRSKTAISSKNIVNCLNYKYGITFGKDGKHIPLEIPSFFVGDYLRGVFDGDGSVAADGSRCDITSPSKAFLEYLQKLSGGIGFIICNRSKNNCYYWVNKKSDTIKFRDIIYNNEEFCLLRKKDRMLLTSMKSRKE